MDDILFLLVTAACGALCLLYVVACERL